MMTPRNYTIISADTHAGGSHTTYREYLDAEFRDEFDAWRGKYKNPFKDLGDKRRFRNWDNEMRNSAQDIDGVVGEVIFPNTVPPFFPSFVLLAPMPSPEDYRRRLAGIRAHNRWLVDFCSDFPERRAGIGQIFVNDIDDAIEDVYWIKEHGLRGGVLLPVITPDCTWLKTYNDPHYDPLWKVCEELDVPLNMHAGATTSYGTDHSAALMYVAEVGYFSNRQMLFFILGGVFERFPKLRYVMTEQGSVWLPPMLAHLDDYLGTIRDTGALGELRFKPEHVLPKSATEYFQQNIRLGVSQPTQADVAVIDQLGSDFFMWGSDFPHDEGTDPFTREHLRQVFAGRSEEVLRKVLGENAAAMYDFDMEALAPAAAEFGPSVSELARPLDALPDNPNYALVRGAKLA